MSNTLKLGNGQWATGKDTILAYNDLNSNYKPLAFSFSRASSGTVVNKAGLIETVGSGEPRIDFKDNTKGALLLEPSRTNSLQYSEDFSQSYWTKGGVTVLSNQIISPKGDLTADLITVNSGSSNGGLFRFGTWNTTLQTFSIFAKVGNHNIIDIGQMSNEWVAVFDIELGIITSVNGNLTSADIINYGNGWYRCSVTHEQSSGNATLGVRVLGENNSVYLYGASLEEGSYATSYIPTSGQANGVTRVADNTYQRGATQVIGQSEGTMYIEFVPKDISAGQILYQIRSSSGTIGQIDIRLTGGQISTLANSGGSSQFNMGFTSYSAETTYKVAVRYKLNDSKIYINGSSFGTDTSCSFTGSSLDQISFAENISSLLPVADILDARLYNTALTDQELIALTS